jgi:hypothetical protein
VASHPLGITDPEDAAWIKTKLTPHPLQTYFENLVLKYPLGNGVRAMYIACTNPQYTNVASSHELAMQMTDWTFVELPTGHAAMLSMAGAPATLLAAVDDPSLVGSGKPYPARNSKLTINIGAGC